MLSGETRSLIGSARSAPGLATRLVRRSSTATGGFGTVTPKIASREASGTLHGPGAKNESLTGYAAGAGGGYFIAPAWSIKAEYQYINLGSATLGGSGRTSDGTYSGSLSADHAYHTIRADLNYHVGEVYEPLK